MQSRPRSEGSRRLPRRWRSVSSSLQTRIARKLLAPLRGPVARAVRVAEHLHRLDDRRVVFRGRSAADQLKDERRRVVSATFAHEQHDEASIGARVRWCELDLLTKRRFRFLTAAEPRQKIAAQKREAGKRRFVLSDDAAR